MSYTEDEPTGIPTRAIHESYIDMQRALHQYRDAVDVGAQRERESAHANLQQAVLTCYELLRPHLKNDRTVQPYWDGQPPNYTRDGEPPDPEKGKGVLQVQVHPQSVELDGKLDDWADDDQDVDPDRLRLEDWHEVLGYGDNMRIQGIQANGENALVQVQVYEMGLRKLDAWSTSEKPVQADLGGFMEGRTTTTVERQRVPVAKLRRAARELGDVAERLGLHANTKTENLPVDEL